jgi:hypothetical protein
MRELKDMRYGWRVSKRVIELARVEADVRGLTVARLLDTLVVEAALVRAEKGRFENGQKKG